MRTNCSYPKNYHNQTTWRFTYELYRHASKSCIPDFMVTGDSMFEGDKQQGPGTPAECGWGIMSPKADWWLQFCADSCDEKQVFFKKHFTRTAMVKDCSCWISSEPHPSHICWWWSTDVKLAGWIAKVKILVKCLKISACNSRIICTSRELYNCHYCFLLTTRGPRLKSSNSRVVRRQAIWSTF
jgi:hypothetical protein